MSREITPASLSISRPTLSGVARKMMSGDANFGRSISPQPAITSAVASTAAPSRATFPLVRFRPASAMTDLRAPGDASDATPGCQAQRFTRRCARDGPVLESRRRGDVPVFILYPAGGDHDDQ